MVFFYGGAWQTGSKHIYRFAAQPFAARGLFVAVPDYRVAPEVAFPVFVEDAAKACRRRRPDGQPRQLSRLATRIREKGGRVQVKLYPGSGHIRMILALAGFLPGRRPPVFDDILAFLESDASAAVLPQLS